MALSMLARLMRIKVWYDAQEKYRIYIVLITLFLVGVFGYVR